jgi:protein associated with RNAse G/E
MEAGHPVRVEMQKWGGHPHWEYSAHYLGIDDHGQWLGIPEGTHMERPGASYISPTEQVCLVPDGEAWFATFHAENGPVQLYIDIATPPIWHPRETHGPVLRAVDLDLDVVRGHTGRVWIDDEDEFAEHRTTYGYPDEIVAMASTTCDEVATRVRNGIPPFDTTTPARWMDHLRELIHADRLP